MKRFLVTLTLTCVLSVSAMAGSIPTCGAPEPTPGDVHNPGAPAPGDQTNGGRTDDGNQGTGGLALLILDLLF